MQIKNRTLWGWFKMGCLGVILFPAWALTKILCLRKGHPWRAPADRGLLEWTLRASECKVRVSAAFTAALGLIGVAVVGAVQQNNAPSYLPLVALILAVVCLYCCFGTYFDVNRRYTDEG